MNLQSIWAVVLRHVRLWLRDYNLIMVTLYWPLLDVLIWGFLGSWMQKMQTSGQNFEIVFLLGILLWQVVSRTAVWISASLVEEVQSYNVVNLFTMPLRLTEWMIGVTLFSLILSLSTAFYCIILMKLFYTVSLVQLISNFFIFAVPLFISGIWLGFMGLQVLVNFGKRGYELMYIFAWAAAPFSSAFYPREVLPEWAKVISYCLPMSYVFEAMRSYLLRGQNPGYSILFATGLAFLYAAVAILVFVYLFNKSKQKGLARLSD